MALIHLNETKLYIQKLESTPLRYKAASLLNILQLRFVKPVKPLRFVSTFEITASITGVPV